MLNDEDIKTIASLITDSEKRLNNRITDSEKRIIVEIGDFIDQNLLPILEDKADKSDIDRIERKLDHFSAQVVDHSQAIKEIKAIPAIAHELIKSKKG